jgi:hypothetical protein
MSELGQSYFVKQATMAVSSCKLQFHVQAKAAQLPEGLALWQPSSHEVSAAVAFAAHCVLAELPQPAAASSSLSSSSSTAGWLLLLLELPQANPTATNKIAMLASK